MQAHLSPAEAASIATRARQALRAGRLTHRAYCLLDCLLWSCRRPGVAMACASYTALQRLTHQSREAIADGLRALEACGLIERTKRRLRLIWHNGGTASRQLTSVYRLIHTESARATVNQGIEVLTMAAGPQAAQEARIGLAEIARRRGVALHARQ